MFQSSIGPYCQFEATDGELVGSCQGKTNKMEMKEGYTPNQDFQKVPNCAVSVTNIQVKR